MMTANKIASSDVLDILFDGRNKAYGAYTLRRNYNKRMTIAIGLVISASLAIFFSSMGSSPGLQATPVVMADSIQLVKVKPDEPLPEIVTPPPPELTQLRTEDFTTLQITPDHLVDPNDLPPTQDDMQDAVISNFKQDGVDAGDIVAPPAVLDKGSGLTVAPVLNDDTDTKTFIIVENVAEFPGGPDAWKRFLERYLVYPQKAIDNGTQGIVRVQFVVDKEGYLSEIKALNDPGDGLAEEAVRILRKSQQWKPAEQNGRKVKYRHIQSITFQLE